MENEGAREYSISELAEEAGVSTRTIRYYVSEGLLPPPVGAGPNSRYTDAHLRQLGIIGRLKEQYLPLREIRRRLIGHVDVPAAPAAAPPPSEYHGPSRRAREIAEDRAFSRMPSSAAHFVSSTRPAPEFLHQTGAELAAPPEREQAWRRVSISDEAELLITEDQYRRHQDKIDWLIQWAKRVLGT
jgi:DNA-binding transcriptional MerR regulator